MPLILPAADHEVVVDRLRSAGCVFAKDEAAQLLASASNPEQLDRMVQQRVAGRPLELVVGWAQFCDLRIAVDPGVFIPRQRTEFLVEQAAALAITQRRPGDELTVLELCCGSGAIGLALAHTTGRRGIRHFEWHAADVDPIAVRCAERNLAAVSAALPDRYLVGRLYEGDLFQSLPDQLRGRVDLLLANTPYVPTGELHLLPAEARLYEPRHTLDGGPDGLDLLRRTAAAATGWLAPGGQLLIEISDRQAPAATAAFTACGLTPELRQDSDRQATVIVGRPDPEPRPARWPEACRSSPKLRSSAARCARPSRSARPA